MSIILNRLIFGVTLFGSSILFAGKSNAQDVVVTCDGCPPSAMSISAEGFLATNPNYGAADVMVYSPSTGVFREFSVTRTQSQGDFLNQSQNGLLNQKQVNSNGFGTGIESVMRELRAGQNFIESQLQAGYNSLVELGGSLSRADFFVNGTYNSAAEALEFPNDAARFIENAIRQNSRIAEALAVARTAFRSTGFSGSIGNQVLGFQVSFSGADRVEVTVQFPDGSTWLLDASIAIDGDGMPRLKLDPTLVARLPDGSLIPLNRIELRGQRFTAGNGDIQSLINFFNGLDKVKVKIPDGFPSGNIQHCIAIDCVGSEDGRTTTCQVDCPE